MTPTRRTVLQGAAAGSLVGGLSLGGRAVAAGNANQTLVIINLRGGMDGLALVAPADDADLIAARTPDLRPADSGSTAGIQLANGLTPQDWRLNPAAPQLAEFYAAGNLAVVHATGSPANTRSHFEMQDMMQRGITDPRLQPYTGGWIARYAMTSGLSTGRFAVGSAGNWATFFIGDGTAVDLSSMLGYGISSPQKFALLQSSYGAAGGVLGTQGQTTLAAMQGLAAANVPAHPSAAYGSDDIGHGLGIAATIIKSQLGARILTVDYTAWDHHDSEGGRFRVTLGAFASELAIFWNDIAAYADGVTVVTLTEFGRRVANNASGGTDHGSASAMMILGNAVKGGRMYGEWPGLAPASLDDGDLMVTTDVRAVMTELLSGTLGTPDATVFPGLQTSPRLGFI